MFKVRYSNLENSIFVLNLLIRKLNVQVSSETIKTSMEGHPYYPSLLSISDCLTEWKIPNAAYQIDKKEYNSGDFSFPLIAHLKSGNRFILINEIKNGNVIFSDEKTNGGEMSEQEFLSKWAGVVLHAEPNSESREQNYKGQFLQGLLNSLRGPILITGIIACILYLFFQHDITWVFTALIVFTSAGLVTSILLLIHSVNSNNPLVQNLCGAGKDSDCNAILKSKKAYLTDWLSWSEVGYFYFAGSLLSLLLVNNSIPYLAILNLCCLPYTFWSIWYQYKMKNWCLLCCSVQFLLWLQFCVIVTGVGYMIPIVDAITIMAVFFSFLIPIMTWLFVKPFILKAEQLAPVKQHLKKFKYNTDLFYRVLTNQSNFPISQEVLPIVLGNPNAETVITVVSNPFCNPCAIAHRALDKWLDDNNDIQVKMIFVASDEEGDPRAKVAKHLISLSILNNEAEVKEALNSWYDGKYKEYDNWAMSYPVEFNNKAEVALNKQKEWCEKAGITFTPTILMNGYKLPEPYVLNDIKYLLN